MRSGHLLRRRRLALAIAWAVAATSLAAAPPARADDEPLTLHQAFERAVAGNINLQRERVNVLTADANVTAALGRFDFVLGANGNVTRSTSPPTSAMLPNITYTTATFGASVSRALETGGALSLGVTSTTAWLPIPVPCGDNSGETCWAPTLTLTLTHPLLRNFGREVTEAALRKARVSKDIALLNRQTRAAAVLRDVAVAYWELAYSTQELAINRSGVALAEEQLRYTKAQIAVGRAAPIDAAAAERAIADRQQQVVVSEQGLAFRALDLQRLFAIPADPARTTFVALDVPSVEPRTIDATNVIAQALEANPQLRSLRMGMQLTALDVKTAVSAFLPQLDFTGSVGASALKTGAAAAAGQLGAFDLPTYSAGLVFQLPVQNRAARGAEQTARLADQLAAINAHDFELFIRDAVLRDAVALNAAARRLELAKATVGFAEKNLQAEKSRFDVGRSTNNDVLLRQQELKQAQIQIVRAAVDLLVAEAQLDAVTGDILERNGITLKGL